MNRTLMDRTMESYNRVAPSYIATKDSQFIPVQYGYHICRRFMHQLPKREGQILVVGSAGGRVACYLARKSGRQVIGVDFSNEMVRIAEERRARQGIPNCSFLRANIVDLKLDSPFLGIACDGMLYHIPSDELPGLLKRFHDALEPEGIFYASFKKGTGSEFQQDHPEFKGAQRAYWYYNSEELKGLFEAADFKVKVERPLVGIFGEKYLYHVWARK